MAARTRAMILIPLLMISFSSPLKGREEGSLVAPDQPHCEHVGPCDPGRVAWTSGDIWGMHTIVPQMQQFFSIINELNWIKHICTKSKINIALFNALKGWDSIFLGPRQLPALLIGQCQNARQSIIKSCCKMLSRWSGPCCSGNRA